MVLLRLVMTCIHFGCRFDTLAVFALYREQVETLLLIGNLGCLIELVRLRCLIAFLVLVGRLGPLIGSWFHFILSQVMTLWILLYNSKMQPAKLISFILI